MTSAAAAPVAASSAFTIERDGDLAIVWFDLPGEKVNKLSSPVLRELSAVIDEIAASSMKAVIFASRKRGVFIAGADVMEFTTVSGPDAAKKYVVSTTLDRADWNAELVRGDLQQAVQRLKREPGKGLFVAGMKLAMALTELELIDEYEFVVHPRLAGHGPTLFAGLTKHVDLKLVSRLEFGSGAVAMRYEPRRWLNV